MPTEKPDIIEIVALIKKQIDEVGVDEALEIGLRALDRLERHEQIEILNQLEEFLGVKRGFTE